MTHRGVTYRAARAPSHAVNRAAALGAPVSPVLRKTAPAKGSTNPTVGDGGDPPPIKDTDSTDFSKTPWDSAIDETNAIKGVTSGS